MYLDRDFDRDDNRRRLLRIHELGHALGYQHVESRSSIMNPSIGPEPTEFDRAGAVIAFSRPVGNRSPDVDPSSTVLALGERGRPLDDAAERSAVTASSDRSAAAASRGSYVARRAVIGSIDAARSAGSRQARAATVSRTDDTAR